MPTRTFDPAAALDRLVRDDPPADTEEYRRWREGFESLYPVAEWRRWSTIRLRRERRRRGTAAVLQRETTR